MKTLRRLLVAAVLYDSVAGMASAQSIESDLPPAGSEPHTGKPGFFFLPDLGLKKLLDVMSVTDEQDRFSAKFGLVVMPADYTTFDQDAASTEQVGNQQDTFEARSLRLMARGHFTLFSKWNYGASYGRVDLDDESVRGGVMDGWWARANWWATRRWKASVTYGDINLDRDGFEGKTRTWLSRIQWIY